MLTVNIWKKQQQNILYENDFNYFYVKKKINKKSLKKKKKLWMSASNRKFRG